LNLIQKLYSKGLARVEFQKDWMLLFLIVIQVY